MGPRSPCVLVMRRSQVRTHGCSAKVNRKPALRAGSFFSGDHGIPGKVGSRALRSWQAIRVLRDPRGHGAAARPGCGRNGPYRKRPQGAHGVCVDALWGATAGLDRGGSSGGVGPWSRSVGLRKAADPEWKHGIGTAVDVTLLAVTTAPGTPSPPPRPLCISGLCSRASSHRTRPALSTFARTRMATCPSAPTPPARKHQHRYHNNELRHAT